MTNQKTALILGATGSIGGQVARTLCEKGWHVRAMHRTKHGIENGIEWVIGDANNEEDVLNASKNAHLIFHGVNPPNYQNWEILPEKMLDNTIKAAKHNKNIIAFPANVYNFGTEIGVNINEDSPQNPYTKKGKVRAKLENSLLEASHEGVQIILLRMGDFFGPDCNSSWLTEGMIKKGQYINSIACPSKSADTKHEWAYLPDAGLAFCELIERSSELPKFAIFNFSSHYCSVNEIAASIAKAQKIDKINVTKVPWLLFKILSPFVKIMGEINEMRYLWDIPQKLNADKLNKFLASIKITTLDEAIKATLISNKNIQN